MTVQEYFGDWGRVMDLREADRLLRKVSSIPSPDGTPPICPLPKDIFRAFRLCPLSSLKAVILGQDPYPNLRKATAPCASVQALLPVATGLAFANSPDTSPDSYSPSLEILKDSVIDFTRPHGTVNFDPSLEKWEEQGVLLLNAALSCPTGRPGSHTLMWRPFLKSLLTNLSECLTGIVYILMGSTAQSFEPYINARSNHVIRIRHPAYYARTGTRMPSDIWKQVNQILIGMYGQRIQWYQEEK